MPGHVRVSCMQLHIFIHLFWCSECRRSNKQHLWMLHWRVFVFNAKYWLENRYVPITGHTTTPHIHTSTCKGIIVKHFSCHLLRLPNRKDPPCPCSRILCMLLKKQPHKEKSSRVNFVSVSVELIVPMLSEACRYAFAHA